MTFNLLQLNSYPIYDQLLLEERLLRADKRNWCILNYGSSPAIVMGISGKKNELIDTAKAASHQIPLIKRFSGGGTVIVDENTLFVTFICQKEIHPFPAYPEPIMRWTEELYKEVFQNPTFALRENDYVLGEKKCGGNAQYIRKERWLHHTTFLWDYCAEKMQCLLHPPKMPPYRAGRPHDEFLCRLKTLFPDKQELSSRLSSEMKKRFPILETTLEETLQTLATPDRQTTVFV